ncbi:DUF1214 domain-containing protein [Leifsonia sp. EB34]|uniref:DUF1214 domain-containing protein n=1 Tax=Leifsonia sp. EB34 TaxID=3156303 RepID=UPI003515BD50
MTAAFTLTDDYIDAFGAAAYLWAWPLINIRNRRTVMDQLPAPGLLQGIAPAAPPGRIAMLHDYVEPAERLVACPNQDVAYGFGMAAADIGPVVIQVPDFGERFWVYQAVDQRTDSFIQLGAMYDSAPGHYLLAPASWDGAVPDGIASVFRYDTAVAIVIPRVFLNDTAEDRAAILPLLSQISMYPLEEYDGTMKSTDWTALPQYGKAAGANADEAETRWVDPTRFADDLARVLDEVPPRPGEEAVYATYRQLADTAATDGHVRERLNAAAGAADGGLVAGLFQFRNNGVPVGNHWSTVRNGARFGDDYLARTAMAKANIFVNAPNETGYFYQDLDADGNRLDGRRRYAITFPVGGLPPVRGFWSLTLYNEHHFFHANDLSRYSLGTKNTTLTVAPDGSLTLLAGGIRPENAAELANWLPAPDGPFSLYLRAYWPEDAIRDGSWAPPSVSLQ